MISLGIARPPVERRNYTAQLTAAVEARAAGQGLVAAATGAVEIAAGAWSRLLSLAIVEPRNRRTEAVTPALLAMAGRNLARWGEMVWAIEIRGGRALLLPASSAYATVGTADPATWMYTITTDGPGNTVTMARPRSAVVHVLYGADAARPWRGRPPWSTASLPADILAGLENQLAGEAGGPSGYVLSVPDTGDHGRQEGDDEGTDPISSLRADLAAAHGRTLLSPTMMGGFGAGPASAPTKDYQPVRFGLNAFQGAVELRRDVERTLLTAYGFTPVLANHAAPGTALRDGWRQLHVGAIMPVADLLAEALSEGLGTHITLDMRRARAADITSLSRAVGSLVDAGVPVDEARQTVGL